MLVTTQNIAKENIMSQDNNTSKSVKYKHLTESDQDKLIKINITPLSF